MQAIPIFTEMLATTGLGHFMRCTALYDAIRERGGSAKFILNSDGTARHLLEKYEVEELDWSDETRLEKKLSGEEPPDFAVIDSYIARPEIYEQIAGWAKTLICVDDTMRIEYPSGATILNPGIGSESLPYDARRHRIFAGAKYVLLRNPFRDAPKREAVSPSIEKILVTTGGEDRHGIVPELMRTLRRRFAKAKLSIIVGPAFRNQSEIEAAADARCELLINPEPQAMFEAMRSADLAIAAGGQTTYELARLGVPMILIRAAENQRGNIEGLVRAGAAVSAGAPGDSDFESEFALRLKNMESMEARRNASRDGMRAIDGRGARRVVDAETKYGGMSLRPVTFEDAGLLLEWANDPVVRGNALNGDRIEEEGHIQWLRGKLASDGTYMYILSDADGNPVGQLRFDRTEDKIFEIGFSIAAEHRGSGLGKLILALSIESLREDLGHPATLRATVKASNPASAKAFVANGFQQTGRQGELLFYHLDASRFEKYEN